MEEDDRNPIEIAYERRRLIEDRAGRKVPRDTHGVLHLDHVYSFLGEDTPGDLYRYLQTSSEVVNPRAGTRWKDRPS